MELNIRNSYLVRPAEPTWHGRKLLSEIDQIGEMTHNVLVYLYKPQNTSPLYSSVSKTLRDSLSRVLVPFYPLAGRLRWINHDDHLYKRGRLELDCNGNGVEFVEAEWNAELDEFGDFNTQSPDHQYLFPAIDNTVPIHELPIMFVQITMFKCGGISISVAASHVVVDGSAIAHFIVEWARLSRGETAIEKMPFHDRNALQGREPREVEARTPEECRFDHYKNLTYLPELVNHQGNEGSAEEGKKLERTVIRLRLAPNQVKKLNKLANEGRRSDIQPYTRYEAISALIWRTMCKVRNNKDEQPTSFLISIDSRRRLKPPLPVGYFGNAILDVVATSFARELVSKSLGYGASKIRAMISKVTDEYVVSTIDYLKKQQDLSSFRSLYLYSTEDFLGDPNSACTSLLNLPIYGVDFGWGKETYVGPGDLKIDGGSVLLHSSEDDGSLVVMVCLLEERVDAFKKYFYQDII